MRSTPGVLVALASTLAAASCARPAMISNRAPNAELGARARVAILVANDSSELRTGVERAFATISGGKGPTFVPATDLLGPGLTWEKADLLRVLNEQKFDAVLWVGLMQAGEETWLAPRSGIPAGAACTSACPRRGTSAPSSDRVKVAFGLFELRLFEAASGEMIWSASYRAAEGVVIRSVDLERALARRTLDQLRADHVVRRS